MVKLNQLILLSQFISDMYDDDSDYKVNYEGKNMQKPLLKAFIIDIKN